jgi:hypothetical protein
MREDHSGPGEKTMRVLALRDGRVSARADVPAEEAETDRRAFDTAHAPRFGFIIENVYLFAGVDLERQVFEPDVVVTGRARSNTQCRRRSLVSRGYGPGRDASDRWPRDKLGYPFRSPAVPICRSCRLLARC